MTDTGASQRSGSHSEAARKTVHIGLGFIAFGLEWLTWPVAAGVAFLALIANALLLPRVGGKAISRDAKGTDLGIVFYPLAVLVLIVLFRNRLEIAAIGWIALALGDGCATLVGRNMRGPKLPWNRDKSLLGTIAFVEAALPIAWLAGLMLAPSEALVPMWIIASCAVVAAAIVESLPTGIDDNLTVPATAAFVAWGLTSMATYPSLHVGRAEAIWLVVNFALAVGGYAAGTVSRSGMVGGAILGCVVIHFGGWHLYLVLLAFFVLGSATTRLGMQTKAMRGIAQEAGGRRGVAHAFANVGVAAICAMLGSTTWLGPSAMWLAAAAALATAAADTTASEVGQLYGRRPFLPLTLKRVPIGTEGAISVEGTIAGACAATIVAAVAAVLWQVRAGAALLHDAPRGVGSAIVAGSMIVVAAVVGSWLESVAGSWNRTRRVPVSNGTLNFLNTAVGAALMFGFAVLLW